MSVFSCLLVAAAVTTVLPLSQEQRPGVLRFTDEDHLGEIAEIVFRNADPRAADDREHAPAPQLLQDLAHPRPLHAHAGQPDEVRTLEPVEVDRLDVLIQ